jgi:hypothetical protein
MSRRERLGDKDIHNDVQRIWALLPSGPHQYMYNPPFSTLEEHVGGIRGYNRFGETFTTREVHISVGTAPTGSAIIVDVNVNGVSIFAAAGDRPQIAAGANTGVSTTISTTAFEHDDYFTVDIDQIGSSFAGADLTVAISVA